MKKKLMTGFLLSLSIISVFAKPGGTYTLTGSEKGLAEIIRADMEKYPTLYKGESLNKYISKFKKENQIGKRKLIPGDQLTFPDTRASISARKAQRQCLIGIWEAKSNVKMKIKYKEDGSYSIDFFDGKIIYSGIWEIKGNYLRTKIKKSKGKIKGKTPSKKWVSHTIICLTETELKIQVEGQNALICKRIK